MLTVVYLKHFKKDIERVVQADKKRAPERKEKIRYLIHTLANEMALDAKYLDHKLKGKKSVFKDRRECHVEPDLLLIYKIEKGSLFLERIGSHSELFE